MTSKKISDLPSVINVTGAEILHVVQGGDSRQMTVQEVAHLALSEDFQNIDGFGIATSWDATNRLAVASPASLFTHQGAGHQLKIDKAASTDTASLLYQDNGSGRAEIGLAGNDDFSINVSPDGNTWTTALQFDATNGHATGEAVQQSATDTTLGRLMRADYGYSPGNLLGTVSQSGGAPTGAVIERGSNANGEYVRFADGTQICTNRFTTSGTSTDVWTYPAAFAAGKADSLQIAHKGQSGLYHLSINWNTSSASLITTREASSGGYTSIAVFVQATGRWF